MRSAPEAYDRPDMEDPFAEAFDAEDPFASEGAATEDHAGETSSEQAYEADTSAGESALDESALDENPDVTWLAPSNAEDLDASASSETFDADEVATEALDEA